MVDIYENIKTTVVADKKGDAYKVRIRADHPYNHTEPYNLTEKELNTVLNAFEILNNRRFPEQVK